MDLFTSLRSHLQSGTRRAMQQFGLPENSNHTLPLSTRLFQSLHGRLGERLKYILCSTVLTMMAFYILLVDVNEQAFHRHRVEYLARQAQLLNSSSNTMNSDRNGIFHYYPLHGNNSAYINATFHGQNETMILHPSRHSMSATTSIWISLMLSLISWMTIIQILRYLRYYQVSSRLAATTRLPLGRQEQYLLAHMIRMSREGDPMAMPQLMSRLRMMLISRDFTG